VVCHVQEKCECGGEVKIRGQARRHQVYELPEIKFEVTEYQVMEGRMCMLWKATYRRIA